MNTNLPRLRVIHPVVIHEQTNRPSTTAKGKIHPRTGHGGPDGEKRYSSTLSLTSALDGGRWSTTRPGRSLPQGKTRYPLYRRLGGPQGRSGQMRKISPPSGLDTGTVQPWASRYTELAIPAPNHDYIFKQHLLSFKTCHMFRISNNAIITQSQKIQEIISALYTKHF